MDKVARQLLGLSPRPSPVEACVYFTFQVVQLKVAMEREFKLYIYPLKSEFNTREMLEKNVL